MHDKGLVFPKFDPSFIPTYICEACQVRAILRRELGPSPRDVELLMLERMRQLDILHSWAVDTVGTYGSKIRRIRTFETQFGVSVLQRTRLERPPDSRAISLLWAHLHYSLDPGKSDTGHIQFSTARGMRSAASLYYQLDAQIAYPHQVLRDQRSIRFVPHAIPTDELMYTLQNSGMARRMGDTSRPSWALQFCHIQFIDQQLNTAYETATLLSDKHELAAAGAANLILWLGMLRGGECFNLLREDTKVIPPRDGPKYGLKPGIGFVEFRLTPETKTSPNKVADIVIAYNCYSGLCLGKWMKRLFSFHPVDGQHLFSTPKRRKWTTTYFRSEYAWPLLELMRIMGEPTLQAFRDQDGYRIRDKIWSCHSWCRGFNSFVKRLRDENFRAATITEVDNHARWEQKKAKTQQGHYDGDADLGARLFVTLLCS